MLESLDTLIAFVLIMLVVSLLITIAVQMLSGALNLRGLNLAIGLKKTLVAISPNLELRAKDLVKRVLTSPILSDSSIGLKGPSLWRLATAVRPDETFAALHRLAIDQRSGADDLRDGARNVLISLGMNPTSFDAADQEAAAANATVKDLWAAANAAAAGLPSAERQKLLDSLGAVHARLAAYATRAEAQTAAAVGSADQAYQKFEYWFEITQDRAQQWFTMHTRFATVFFALIFAGWFQLDTVEIFHIVSSNRSVRDALVAQAGVVHSQAERLLGDGQSVLQEALDHWAAGQEQDTQRSVAGIKVGTADSRGAVRAQLAAALTNHPAKERLLAAFDTAVDTTASQRLDQQAGDFRQVKADLDHTGFELFPASGKGRWGEHWSDHLADHLWGMIFSAGLLSLGAPFWYNTLKGLTSLRSTVARSVSEERKQEAPPTSNAPSPPPPIP